MSILNYRNRTILSYLVRRSVLFLTRYDRQKIAFLNILTLRQIDVTEKVRLNTQKTHYDERLFCYYFFLLSIRSNNTVHKLLKILAETATGGAL